jgi:hypothetical protein
MKWQSPFDIEKGVFLSQIWYSSGLRLEIDKRVIRVFGTKTISSVPYSIIIVLFYVNQSFSLEYLNYECFFTFSAITNRACLLADVRVRENWDVIFTFPLGFPKSRVGPGALLV